MAFINGAALVNITLLNKNKTFGEYCESNLGKKLKKAAVDVNQLDLVFDVYREHSLKTETWYGRRSGMCISVEDENSNL